MEIKTKFAIGDKVWHLWDDKATQTEITSVITVISQIQTTDGIKEKIKTEYAGQHDSSDRSSMYVNIGSDERCFATKEELMQYVISE